MSDGHDYKYAQHQDWQGGPPWARPDEPPGSYFAAPAQAGSQPSTPSFSPDASGSAQSEAEHGNAAWAIIQPPLLGASRERLEACQMAIAMVLLNEGAGMRDAVRYAKKVVERLGEVLE